MKRGYRPGNVRLHYAETPDGELQRAARCRILWAEMLAWEAGNGAFPARGYDGTVRSLCNLFQTDEFSPYKKAKWNSQRLYDQYSKIIVNTVGDRVVRALLGPDFMRWHTKWGEPKAKGKPPRLARAKHAMDTLRRVVSFGVILGFQDCAKADIILGKLRFEAPAPRKEKLTRAQVESVCRKAHELGLHSIALATMLQFELAFRQKDVIGEWEPCTEETAGGIFHNGTRWVSGLTWSHIDADLILRKVPVKTKRHGIEVEHNLKLYPTLMDEISRIPLNRRVGPVILSEATGEPYKHRTFTQTWRRVAKAAGIPSQVKNMDARAGAISEAYDSGADETSVMKHAGHRNRQTSARYNRGSLEQTSRVAVIRQAKQKPNKP
ncbi:MAG: site-specific integrase [Rhizobiales bacterium]|nr:site-specific integrase [Hyphomicrobiales bacterium]